MWAAERGAFLSRMERELATVLDPLLPRGVRCALVDFPDYGNVGDSAIWLGEMDYLRRIGASVVYACDLASFSPARLRERLEDGVILLSGGGNLGDLWPAHQRLREAVIKAFPDHRIIQLPQSVHFDDKAALDRARAAFDAHSQLVLLLRDHRSLAFARGEFGAPCLLCPDLSLALGPLARRPARRDVLWLLRGDQEARNQGPAPLGVESVDWLEEPRSWLLRANRLLSEPRSWPATLQAWTWPALASFYDRVWEALARERLSRGCALLSEGEVVVTDRLHGHLLSVLLGIPHVVLDNSYGKIRDYYDTWTHSCGLTHWATTPEEASLLARRLGTLAPAGSA